MNSPLTRLAVLTRSALEGVSYNVLIEALAHRDFLAARAEIRAAMNTGKAMSANRDALLKAVK